MTVPEHPTESRFPFVDDVDLIEVGVGQLAIGQAPKRLYTPALGSCVGLTLWDPGTRQGGLAHIMLPSPSANTQSYGSAARFATYAVPVLLRMLTESGVAKRRLQAKVVGGASMFRGESGVASIGERNIAETRRQLALAGIEIAAEDTGEAHARTIELVLDTGELLVRSYKYGLSHL